MSTLYLLFLIVAAPILFFMVTWTVVTAWRLLVPEKPLPLDRDPVRIREKATAAGLQVPVGAKEIRADQRHHYRTHGREEYVLGASDGVPTCWMEDVWQRRN